MTDLENNMEYWETQKESQFLSCTCEFNTCEQECEICFKGLRSESDLPMLSSMSLRQDPVTFASFLMALAIFLHSTNSVIVREFIVVGGTGYGFLFLRAILSIPLLLVLTYGINFDKKNPVIQFTDNRKVNMVMIAGCASGAFRQSLLPFIMKTSEASTIGILAPSVPLVTAVFSHLFNLEKITKVTVFCLALSTGGLVFGLDLLNKITAETRLSYFLLSLVPITKSFQVIFLKMSSEYVDGWTLLRHQIAISIALSFPFSILVAIFQSDNVGSAFKSLLDIDFRKIMMALYSVVGTLFLSWRIQIYCLKVIGANATALFQTLRPIFTILMGTIFLGEELTFKKVVGSFVVCSALVIYQRSKIVRSEEH